MADENASPISAAKPPVTNPMASATASHAATLKLKPVIRKPGEGGVRPTVRPPVAPAAPAPAPAPAPAAASAKSSTAPLEALKGITQKLKGVTQAIPQQAILHKTGIIAEQDLTDAQKQASKARTARISLSDAIGVAPVKNEAAPMKTIRIKRPVDISGSAPAASAAAPAAAPAEASVTQRKTLKIARPTAARPAAKPGLKKPAAAPKPEAPAEAEGEVPEIADIPDVPEMEPVAAAPAVPANAVSYSKVAMGLSIAVQIAACAAMGVLVYWFYNDVELIFAF